MRSRAVLDRFAGWVVLASMGVATASGAAPTFLVNSSADVPASANVMDGVCETAPGNGVCTLRAAIEEANHVPGGGALVRVPAGIYFLTIPPGDTSDEASGDLFLSGTTVVEGAAPSATIIDANGLGNAFFALGTGVVIRNLTVQGAEPQPDAIGSGIVNFGVLSLENVMITGNRGTIGGGVYNTATLSLRHCVVLDNQARPFGGGAIGNVGGTVHIADSELLANDALDGARGGAIYNVDGVVTIERSSIVGNDALGTGSEAGGIYSDGSEAQLFVVNSSVDENSTRGHGGGIGVFGGTATLIGVLVVSNEADRNGDSPIPDGAGSEVGGGIYEGPVATVLLKNSLVSSNVRGGASPSYDECGPNAIESQDYLVISYPATCTLTGQTAHVNTSDLPFLHIGERLGNGGFAPLRNPDTGETTNQIPPANCTDAFGAPLATDQRGYARAYGNCDIGSYEAAVWVRPDPLLGRNLLRNGGAAGDELGIAWPQTPLPDAPYWRRSEGDAMHQVLYGSTGFTGTAAPTHGAGSYFFTGGGNEVSLRVQEFDVGAAGAAIDAGLLPYHLSGWFGGSTTDADYAELSVEFWSPESGFIGVATIGGFGPAERANQTKLLPDSVHGLVPVETRYVYVYLRSTMAGGGLDNYNDGYADKLSFSVPEPAMVASGIAALAALAARRRLGPQDAVRR